MQIRKARKKDALQYTKLAKISNCEYSKIINNKSKYTEKEFAEDFYEAISSKNKLVLVAQEKKDIIGYLVGSFDIKQKIGKIDFLFTDKKFRGKKIATKLAKEFEIILKKKKIKLVKLRVHIKNNNAKEFYNRIGFKINHYEMEKELK